MVRKLSKVKPKMKKTKGFTLIELLIAVSIMIMLAAVGVISYLVVTRQSYDNKRKIDIELIKSALLLYYSNNDFYPASPLSSTIQDSAGNIYLDNVPQDPRTGVPYNYETRNGSECFWLKADLEEGLCYVVTGGSKSSCPTSCSPPP